VGASRAVVEAARVFAITVSFGSVNSSISLPVRMSHASIPADVRREVAIPADLVRVSIGIEDADDLIADLSQALAVGTAVAREKEAVAAD
jgi:cystathionine beta-lyase